MQVVEYSFWNPDVYIDPQYFSQDISFEQYVGLWKDQAQRV